MEPILPPARLVLFSACPAFVEWEGELHRTGHYSDPRPGQTMTVTKAHLDAWVRNHRHAPAKLQHTDTPIDKALAPFGLVDPPRVEYAGLDASGQAIHVLRGKVRVPVPLAELLGDHRDVSVGIEPDHSRIREVSFALGTRVGTAKVFAQQLAVAFAAYEREHPDAATDFSLDPIALEATDPATALPTHPSPMNWKNLIKALRAAGQDVKALLGLTDAQVGTLENSEALVTLPDAGVPASVVSPPAPVVTPPVVAPAPAPTGIPAVAPAFAGPIPPEVQATIDGLVAANALRDRQHVHTLAHTFFADQLRAGKATPAMQAGVVAEFSAAVIADTGNRPITFSQDGAPTEGAFLKAIRQKYADAPVYFSTQLQVPHVADAAPTDAAAAISDADLAAQLGIAPTTK